MKKSIDTIQQTEKLSVGSYNLSVDWFRIHREATWNKWYQSKSVELKCFFDFLWPVALHFSSPIPSIFIAGNYNPSLLNFQPLWIVRDGLVPLLWFFNLNPRPEGFGSKLLIHEQFAPFIPNAWRRRTGTYRIVNNPDLKVSCDKKIMAVGILAESYCSIPHLKKILKTVTQQLDNGNLNSYKKTLALFQKYEGAAEQKWAYCPDFMMTVAKAFGADDVTALTWQSFEAASSFAGNALVDLNENLLCADSHLVHSALSRGAHLLVEDKRVIDKTDEYVALSPFHGYLINKKLKATTSVWDDYGNANKAMSFFKKIQPFMDTAANNNFPWPKWINSFAKSMSENSKKKVKEVTWN